MSKKFLYTLLDSMSVSGHEIPLQKKVIAEMTPHCDKIITDYTGNVVCVLNPDAPFKVMLAAHIDEIGLIVTHIQPDGLLRVSKSGGIFPGVYPGHQVAVHGYAQTAYGAVVRSKDMDKADLKADELYIDIGAKDAADARKYVQEGDPVHMNTYHREMINGFLSARGIDDRAVTPNRIRKSLGAETTLPEDTDDRKRLMLELEGIREEVWNRLQRHEFRGKTVVLKLKYADFRQITRSKTLPAAVESADTLRRVAEELLAAVDLRGRRVRLIGLTVGNSPEACADCVQLRFDFGE